MEIKIHQFKGNNIAEIISDKIEINNVQGALDLMADCDYNGARIIILKKENLHPDFFDLSTKLAGNILQKFTNYSVQLGIIGDFSIYKSKSLHDLIYECNKTGHTVFSQSFKDAKKMLRIRQS